MCGKFIRYMCVVRVYMGSVSRVCVYVCVLCACSMCIGLCMCVYVMYV